MFIRIESCTDYPLYLNDAQVVTVYQDHDRRWVASMADGGDYKVSESEARHILGRPNHSFAID